MDIIEYPKWVYPGDAVDASTGVLVAECGQTISFTITGSYEAA